ncbi:MAG: hypothetical protein A3J38_03030 [Gammaproteobacteria bacterium RIFCSPHIGHO2_12_FULL_45_9]|nr:MAG: hypothetical protein A3J38_03030 [Gammaproteobacteria bacterium RIFCSPHIGHO2_12_FULL_45_9]
MSFALACRAVQGRIQEYQNRLAQVWASGTRNQVAWDAAMPEWETKFITCRECLLSWLGVLAEIEQTEAKLALMHLNQTLDAFNRHADLVALERMLSHLSAPVMRR